MIGERERAADRGDEDGVAVHLHIEADRDDAVDPVQCREVDRVRGRDTDSD